MATNPTSKTGQSPQEPDQPIMPLCPWCSSELTAEAVQLQLSPNPRPPLPPSMLIVMVVCRACYKILPIQATLLVNPMGMEQEPEPPPAKEKSKIWSPH